MIKGEKRTIVEDHVVAYVDYIHNMNIEHEYVYTLVFVQSREGEVRKWFHELPRNSIPFWEELKSQSLKKWEEKRDQQYYMTEFDAMKRKNGESIPDISMRFNNIYNSIPLEI